jgi:hypothetical protein
MAADAEEIIKQLRQSTLQVIKKADLNGVWINGKHYLFVDIDTSVLDNSKTKKEGVSRTYQGYDGYHPIFAYVGKEGYMIDCELRPGSQHCQKGTADFISGLIPSLHELPIIKRYLFRLDSGNDAWETIQAIIGGGEGHYFIIKRNKRKETDENWLETAKKKGVRANPRKGKTVWIGITPMSPEKNGEIVPGVKCVFEITERTIDAAGTPLLIPEIEVNTWWTNLNCDAEKVIELYHDHATSEQFHSELKHDMDVERLPSGKFAINKILLAVAMNAYNALRLLGQLYIECKGIKKPKRKRISKVIRDIICVAGKVVKHAGYLIFKVYERDPITPIFMHLNLILDSA